MDTSLEVNGALPLFCAPPISWCKLWSQQKPSITTDPRYQKQHYFNRFFILGSTGVLMQTIPIKKYPDQAPLTAIKICYDQNWASRVARAIRFAYSKSAFYEHYWPELAYLFQNPPEFLLEFNQQLLDTIVRIAFLPTPNYISESTQFPAISSQNWGATRTSIPPQKHYFQLFGNEFYPDLSILDALFNLGTELPKYLTN
ncbi:MAG: WbqC family protein [Bacteroidia bacterium]|nr:WbqC family protein [Bacteroidia bacterium]